MTIIGLKVHVDSLKAAALFTCVVRRITGNPDATPNPSPGISQIRVMGATSHPAAQSSAETFLDACARDLEIERPRELVSVVY